MPTCADRQAVARGHRPQRGGARRTEGRHPPAAGPCRRPGGRAADVPGHGGCRSAESPGRRADARGRRDPAVCAQFGAGAGADAQPGHEQERREPPVRREDDGATGRRGKPRSLDGLDLVGLLIDGVHIGEHCLIVALGIAADGQKHALGLWDGSTENARVCQDLLANLQSRGLRTDRSLLVILDGSKALRKAVRATFGEAALVQRCQVHKARNILDYLSDRDRPWAQAILRRAYQATDMKTAQRLLLDLARRLETEYPSAAESVREGLDETLTVLTLQLSPRLRRSLATTNAAESLISRTRHREAQRQALAGRADDAALGRRGRPRSRQGLPSAEGVC